MKKNKRTEIVKSIAASVLSIGILSATFIGVNNLVFAAESKKTESITPVKETVDISTLTSTIPEDYKSPSLTIFELEDYSNLDANTISSEEAAEIGARYIWEIFGEDIDSKTVMMYYEASQTAKRTYWMGSVGDSQSEVENGTTSFWFVIDAISGEKKCVQIFRDVLPFTDEEAKAKEPYRDDPEKSMEISIEYAKKRKERAKELYQNNPEEYMKIAKEAAQKHFTNSKVADAVYLEDRSNDGIVFMVKDDTGHEIDIAIYSETKQLEFIDDRRDEIDPNFIPDPNAVG